MNKPLLTGIDWSANIKVALYTLALYNVTQIICVPDMKKKIKAIPEMYINTMVVCNLCRHMIFDTRILFQAEVSIYIKIFKTISEWNLQ